MIPEGGIPSIPGMPSIPGAGGEYFDFEDELAQLAFFGGDSDATWAKRQKIWSDAINLCRKERGLFEKALKDIESQAMIHARTRPFGNYSELDYDVKAQVDTWNKEAMAAANEGGKMNASEMTRVQTWQEALVSANNNLLDMAKQN